MYVFRYISFEHPEADDADAEIANVEESESAKPRQDG
jgi:hypothetical protein